jgi:hypothetical protein
VTSGKVVSEVAALVADVGDGFFLKKSNMKVLKGKLR